MAAELPDELTLEILSHTLKLPDEQFEKHSDLDITQVNSAACLAVCKSWLQIGTPLLYHTVVLRSNSQADALALSLRDNKTRGPLIERLRIEGGYGGVMYAIIKAARNVKVLCLTLYVRAVENVSGLCRALPMLRPTRVVLYDQAYQALNNNQTSMLRETLNSCIKKWKTMEQLYFPYFDPSEMHHISAPIDALTEAIKNAPSLRELEMPFCYTFPKHLLVMAQNPHLRIIRVHRQHAHAGVKFSIEHTLENDGRLKNLVVFVDRVM